MAEFGPIYLNFLVRFQWPAYMHLIIRHFLRLGQRAREAGTDPGTWLRSKWRALVKPVLFRIVRVYLFVSAILLLTVIGIVARNAVSFNMDGLYCDHEVAGQAGVDGEGLPEANWSVQGEPCELQGWNVFSYFGVLALIVLAAVQSPAYLFLIVRYVLRRWRGADAQAQGP